MAQLGLLNDPNKICDGDIKHCVFTRDLIQTLSHHHRHQNIHINTVKIAINNFLHAVHSHPHDAEFMYIFQEIKFLCDVTKCKMFQRVYRDRNRCKTDMHSIKKLYEIDDTAIISHQVVLQQIMDKIHCYYLHCYDIGHKLNPQEMNEIEQTLTQSNVSDGNKNKQYIINQQLKRIHDALMSKRKLYCSIAGARSVHRFTTQTIENDEKQDENDDIRYSFGVQFKYDMNDTDGIYVTPKYSSLKEEMTCNPIIAMNIHQFEHEYIKAVLHHNSRQRKMISSTLSLQDILVLLIHCNYDDIQFHFNQTYRKIHQYESMQSISNRHRNFYFLGKYLKSAIKGGKHGCYGNTDGKCKSFYHGVSQKMLFGRVKNANRSGLLGSEITQISNNINNNKDPNTLHLVMRLRNGPTSGVSFYAPLSTTSSYEIAANFATEEGIVIEFGGCCTCKYFQTNWLSDFGNEEELLFVQSGDYLDIRNIILCHDGMEMKHIFQALEIITYVLCGGREPSEVNDSLIEFAKNIVHHQLSHTLSNYERFTSLFPYAEKVIDAYFCNSNNHISINWKLIHEENKYEWLCDLVCCTEYNWIKLDVLNLLFARAKTIEIHDVTVSAHILEDVLSYLSSQNSSINHIEFRTRDSNDSEVVTLQRHAHAMFFQRRFEAIQFSIDYVKHMRSDLIIKNATCTSEALQSICVKRVPNFVII